MDSWDWIWNWNPAQNRGVFFFSCRCGFCAMPKFMANHLPGSKVRTLRSAAAGGSASSVGSVSSGGATAVCPGVGHATGHRDKPGAAPMSQQQQLDFDLWHLGANINQPATAHSQGRHHTATTTTKGCGPTLHTGPCTRKKSRAHPVHIVKGPKTSWKQDSIL